MLPCHRHCTSEPWLSCVHIPFAQSQSAAWQATHSCSLCFVFLKQDLDQVQLHLEEVRFFGVFGFSEAAGAWQCFMCNSPERATGERPLPPWLLRTMCAPGVARVAGTPPWWLSSCINILSWNNVEVGLTASALC